MRYDMYQKIKQYWNNNKETTKMIIEDGEEVLLSDE